MNFEEWQVELAAGHTSHAQYHDWLDERIADNRRLTREAAAEEQKRDKRLLANSLQGWGQGLNQPPRIKVVMSKDGETITQQPRVEETPPLPATGEQPQRDPHTSTDGPLLSGLVPLVHSCCWEPSPYSHRTSLRREPSQTDRIRALDRTQEWTQPAEALEVTQIWRSITMAHRAKRKVRRPKIN